jgi:uncharacterized protein YndB with AHSA1/START domain
MDTILHVVEIHAEPQKVFDAVATASGLSRWWTTRVTSDERAGGMVKFEFIPDFNPEMEITEMSRPGTVAWKCVAGADPWRGATIRFDISRAQPDHTQLTFTQRYAGSLPDVAFGTFNFNWAYYLHSLQQYVETGAGTPHPGE